MADTQSASAGNGSRSHSREASGRLTRNDATAASRPVERAEHGDDKARLLDAFEDVGPHAMGDADEGEKERREQQPQPGANERRPQATDRARVRDERIDEIRCCRHGSSPRGLSRRRRLLIARCVATFSAGIDRPLAAAASFKDISFNFSIVSVWR